MHLNLKETDLKSARLRANERKCENCMFEPVGDFQPFSFPKSSNLSKDLAHFIIEESHQISLEQLFQFSCLTDLNFFKRELINKSDYIQLLNESLFVEFFIKKIPLPNEGLNNSVFSIYSFFISNKCFLENQSYSMLAQKCIEFHPLANDNFFSLFCDICNSNPFPIFWEYVLLADLPPKYFLKCVEGLITYKIEPPDRKLLISKIISTNYPGFFKILTLLNISETEINEFHVIYFLFQALNSVDMLMVNSSLNFFAKHINMITADVIQQIFMILNVGDFQKKEKMIDFFSSILGLLTLNNLNVAIENNLIELAGEMLSGCSQKIIISALQIFQYLLMKLFDASIGRIMEYYETLENIVLLNNSSSITASLIICEIDNFNASNE